MHEKNPVSRIEAEATLPSPELETLVAKLFCEGHTPAAIVDLLYKDHRIKVSREVPWKLLARAARKGKFRYIPDAADSALRKELKARYNWLEVEVVETAVAEDVARWGAEELLRMVQNIADSQRSEGIEETEVHIGFAGGFFLRLLARSFADIINGSEPVERLPRTIVFHALVGGYPAHEVAGRDTAGTDPNFFYAYFAEDYRRSRRVRTRLVPLNVPGMVRPEQVDALKEFDQFKSAYDQREQIHIFVTSASEWDDPDNLWKAVLRRTAGGSPGNGAAAKVPIGDMMWQPVGAEGPISPDEMGADYRFMTLVGLDELKDLILNRKRRVLLVIGPCALCMRPKPNILRAILDYSQRGNRLVSDLVVDSRTARILLGH